MGAIDNLNAKLDGIIKGSGLKSLTDAEVRELIPLAQQYKGGSKFTNITDARTFLTSSQFIGKSASEINSIMTQGLTGAGVEEYGTKVNTRVSAQDPDVLMKLVDQTYQATLGRNATKDEQKVRLQELQKMINVGTKTTTTTFKGGSTTKDTVGFSGERAQAEMATAIEKEAPGDLEDKRQIDFHNFILKNMGG